MDIQKRKLENKENAPPTDSDKKMKSNTSAGGKESQNSLDEELALMEQMEAEEAEMGGTEPQQFIPPDLMETEDSNSADTEQQAQWGRPALAPINPETDDVCFQWVDIDMIQGQPLQQNPKRGAKVPGAPQGPVPVVRLYGVSEAGNSVLAHVHGATPYLYAACPRDFPEARLGDLRQALNEACRARARGSDQGVQQCVLGVTLLPDRASLYGYNFDRQQPFLQIFTAMPTMVPTLRRLLEDGVTVPGYGLLSGQPYEANVPFVLRYMIDNGISGANWLELKAGTYAVRPAAQRTSRCQLEVDVCYDQLASHPAEGRWSKLAPLRILSTDIECMGRKGHFPEPERDPVIQIANVVHVQGEARPAIKNVFTLGGCLPIAGSEVITSETEAELLDRWAAFVRACDPDIITGYNIQNFDVPYLLKRAQTLSRSCKTLGRFAEWGRIRGSLCKMKDTTFQSSAHGKRENVETTAEGRVFFDLIQYMYRNHKLSSYSLNSVSAEFLGAQKEDVHHSIISDLQRGTDEDRRRLAVYCIKDAELPQLLLAKLSVMVNYVEMARVTGVPINYLVSRGQQIKVYSMLLRKCRGANLLIPTLARQQSGDETYTGATVIDPKKSFYQEPIATLDFASLYPSIMQAYNLCYSTLVAKAEAPNLSPEQYQTSPSGDVFVTAATKKGILPLILDELLAARKQAKRDMARATDPMEKAVQNGRQLALKISANSVYGFTGATVGQLPCLPIASSVTSYGRDLLFQTKSFVEEHYTIQNGYPYNAEVVYGDTDSVMVKFGHPTVAEAMPMAEKAAEEVSKIFPRPILLEFEKVYFPYLLMNKKRYAGLLWTRPEKYDKMDTKGLETVRRDNCALVRKCVDSVLRKILIDRDVPSAIEYTKGIIADLLQNKMDISYLVITKSLGRGADSDDYAAKQAHVELAMRMRKRDPGSAPNVGDRVPYVIVKAAKGAPAYEKSEDPVYVLENSLPIDVQYYLDRQLSGPLTRIFEPIIDNPQALFKGAHTRSIAKPTPKAKAGGIMMFAVKKLSCMGCKAPISEKEKTFCVHCRPREAEFYSKKLTELNACESLFSQLWTQCQRCQGSLHQDVLCSNRDCPIFYKRKKVQKDLKDAQDALDKYSW